MEITVYPSPLKGIVEAPPSKSLTQRAIAAGLLADGTTVICNPSFCNDSLAAISMAKALGARVSKDTSSITIRPGRVAGSPVELHCGESGLALRMFSPLAALLSDNVSLTGEGSLVKRPVKMIEEALIQLGVTVKTSNGLLPVILRGRLRGGRAVIDGSTGSQLLTGLLMALPLAGSDSEIEVSNLKSRPYISLTLELLSDFGVYVENRGFSHFIIPGNQSYQAREYSIEGDWSGAAFLLVAGAVAGTVTVRNLKINSLQADMAIMQALHDAGCRLTVDGGRVMAERYELRAFNFDATDCPDLFPPLAALAARCSGTSRIRGVSRLEHKESDRAGAITAVLSAMDIRARIVGDEMLIRWR
ncbi:MAG: 3-phosphoshikimate 1-carboxyvinyltransferase [Bacteroidales bacterium]|nr:3-phosphoshikimate 1-carboxyvinyltransferase [Bacteroidales bacterium]